MFLSLGLGSCGLGRLLGRLGSGLLWACWTGLVRLGAALGRLGLLGRLLGSPPMRPGRLLGLLGRVGCVGLRLCFYIFFWGGFGVALWSRA